MQSSPTFPGVPIDPVPHANPASVPLMHVSTPEDALGPLTQESGPPDAVLPFKSGTIGFSYFSFSLVVCSLFATANTRKPVCHFEECTLRREISYSRRRDFSLRRNDKPFVV